MLTFCYRNALESKSYCLKLLEFLNFLGNDAAEESDHFYDVVLTEDEAETPNSQTDLLSNRTASSTSSTANNPTATTSPSNSFNLDIVESAANETELANSATNSFNSESVQSTENVECAQNETEPANTDSGIDLDPSYYNETTPAYVNVRVSPRLTKGKPARKFGFDEFV
jgi:hypothetical protein